MSDETCGHPTTTGAPCRNHPLGGPNKRCFRHSGIPSTEKQLAANRKHGYFVKGFLDDEERARFEEFVRGGVEPANLKERLIAALILRAERMMRWEGSGERGERVSGYTTGAFAELRQTLETVDIGEPVREAVLDEVELLQRMEALLRSDRDLLLRQLPEEVRKAAKAAWDVLDAAEAARAAPAAEAGTAAAGPGPAPAEPTPSEHAEFRPSPCEAAASGPTPGSESAGSEPAAGAS